MRFLSNILRLLDALATGIGVVLGLVPDPTRVPAEQEIGRIER